MYSLQNASQSVEQNITVPIKLVIMDKTEINSILEHRTGGGSNTNDGSSTTKDDSLVAFAI